MSMQRSGELPAARSEPPAARRIVSDRRGAMLAFVAVTMTILLGCLVLVIDIGESARQRRTAQAAADAGALAGAAELYKNAAATATAYAKASSLASSYGFTESTPGGGGTLGEIAYPSAPTSGPYSGNTSYVEVTITRNVPSIFGALFNRNSIATRARAVAGVGSYSLTCVYLTDPSITTALTVGPGGKLYADCGASVNASSARAIENKGQVRFAGGISVVGGVTGSGQWDPSPTLGAPPVNTPIALAAVGQGSCMPPPGTLTISTSQTISAGTYCGGINVTAGTLTMNSGTYIMAGGGFSVAAEGKVLGTSGITIVNSTSSAYPFKPFKFYRGCDVQLAAQSSGTLAGILLMQDASAPADSANWFGCVSSGNQLSGVLYFPTQTIAFGNPANPAGVGDPQTDLAGATGTIVARKLSIATSQKLTITRDKTTSNPVKRPVLVE